MIFRIRQAVVRKFQRNSLLSGSAIYLFSNIVNAAIPFALLPILTRYLTPAQYGEVAMFQTLLAALSALTGLSVHGAANRKYYDSNVDGQDLKHFIGACLQVLLLSTAIVFVAIIPFQVQLSEWLGLRSRWILWAVVISAATFVIGLRLGQWQVRKQARQYGAFQISQSILNMVLSLLLVVLILKGEEGRITAQIGAIIIFALLSLYFLHKDGLLSFISWKPVYFKEALDFGIPLIPHIAGMLLLTAMDRFVINSELGLAQVGIYMVAVQMSMAMGIVFDAINKAYVPWLFERLKRDVATEKQQIVKYTYLYFAGVFFVAVLAYFVGPFAVTLIAGELYADAGEVIGWLALGQAFGGMYLMVTNYIFYSKRTGLLSLTTVISGLINVALLLTLIKFSGLKGASIAFCLAMAIRFLLTWWVAQRRHPMPWLLVFKSA